MTSLLTEAFDSAKRTLRERAKNLPDHLQDEIAEQLIEYIEEEMKWQQELAHSQSSILDDLAAIALNESHQRKSVQRAEVYGHSVSDEIVSLLTPVLIPITTELEQEFADWEAASDEDWAIMDTLLTSVEN